MQQRFLQFKIAALFLGLMTTTLYAQVPGTPYLMPSEIAPPPTPLVIQSTGTYTTSTGITVTATGSSGLTTYGYYTSGSCTASGLWSSSTGAGNLDLSLSSPVTGTLTLHASAMSVVGTATEYFRVLQNGSTYLTPTIVTNCDVAYRSGNSIEATSGNDGAEVTYNLVNATAITVDWEGGGNGSIFHVVLSSP